MDCDLECLLGYDRLDDEDILATLQFVLDMGYVLDSAVPVDQAQVPREMDLRDPVAALTVARSARDAAIIFNLVGRNNLPVALSFDFGLRHTTLSVYGGRITRSVITRFLDICRQVAALRAPELGYLGPEDGRPAVTSSFDPLLFGPETQASLGEAYAVK